MVQLQSRRVEEVQVEINSWQEFGDVNWSDWSKMEEFFDRFDPQPEDFEHQDAEKEDEDE